jgi:hypothetical protein
MKRSFLDKILGKRKIIDEILFVKSQINFIRKKINENYPILYTKAIPVKYSIMSEIVSIVDDEELMKTFGENQLLKRYTDSRDKLIELAEGTNLDFSEIKLQIREQKLKSIGI